MSYSRLKSAAFHLVSRYSTRYTLMEGNLRESGLPFRCLTFDNSNLTPRLLEQIFCEPPKVHSTRRVLYSALPDLFRNPADRPDLVIAALPSRCKHLLDSAHDFMGQQSVHQVLHMSPQDEPSRRRLKKCLTDAQRVVRKGGFRYEISTSIADFDFFFHRMYLPHATRKFGKFSGAGSYTALKQCFQRGFLLQVYSGDKLVAGEIDSVRGDMLVNHRIGILDGAEEHTLKGAQVALYYFGHQLALERGLSSIDLGLSLAKFRDGVYKHKRHWGAAAHPEPAPEMWFFFRIPEYSPAIVSLLRDQPLIVLGPHGLTGLVGYDGSAPPDEATLEHWRTLYGDAGIKALFVITPGANKPLEFVFSHIEAEGSTA